MRAIALLTLVVLCGPGAAGSVGVQTRKAKAPATPAVDVENLVWPGPPERPRVRFVAAIRGSADLQGKVKLSFIERMAGRSPARDQRLQKPYGVAVDNKGRIFVADGAQRAVVVFDREHRKVDLWRGTAQFPLALPVAVAFDGKGQLFVADSSRGQIVVFAPDGKAVAAFGRDVIGRPGGLAIDAGRRRLYVADAKLDRVFVFDVETFAIQLTIGEPARSDTVEFGGGVFSGASNVAVDAAGRIYVTDTFNCRIQVFDPAGNFLRSIGSQGTRPGQFIRPKGIALDSEDHLYVVDAAFNNFQVLASDGSPLMFVGASGEQPGHFLLPAGLAIDRQDRIYVTEQAIDGGRLQIFQYLGDDTGRTPAPKERR